MKIGNFTLSDWTRDKLSDSYYDRFIIGDMPEDLIKPNLAVTIYKDSFLPPRDDEYRFYFYSIFSPINDQFGTSKSYSSFEEAAGAADNMLIKYWKLKAFL